jgi:peptide chain release factor 1
MEKSTAYIEVKGATGGDEAKIWASDLLRMYIRFAVKQAWNVVQIDEYNIAIIGNGAFDSLKNETGVHRVQRVPTTEKRGRVHTSTATVAVLPQIAAGEVNVNEADLDWQFFRASGAGGQNVNKVSTAVRLTHRPSGIIVTSQEERSQSRNREIALDLLRARLWEKEAEIADYRSLIGRGKRAEKIRTYNYAQNRVTDHRINKKWHNLESILEGNLEKIIEAMLLLG